MKNAYEETINSIFTEEMIQEIESRTGSKVERISAKKNNRILNGITIREGDVGIAFYEEDCNDMSSAEIVDRIVARYQDNLPMPTSEVQDFANSLHNWEYAKEHLTLRAVSQKKNAFLSDEFVVFPYLDLYLVPIVKLQLSDGVGSTKIPKGLFAQWGVTEEEVFECAKKVEYQIKSLSDVIMEIMGMSEEENVSPKEPLRDAHMVVVSNNDRIDGAGAIAKTEIFRELAELWETDVVIIPSSVHELLCGRYESGCEEELKSIVESVNRESVSEEDYLSDTLYWYKREENKVSILLADDKTESKEGEDAPVYREI